MATEPVKSEAELVAESEEVRAAGAWEEEPAEVKVRRRPTREVVSFRLASEELDKVETAANKAGLSLSEFIRRALMAQLEGSPLQSPSLDRFDSSALRLVVRNLYGGSITCSAESDVNTPDFPPLTAQGLLRLPLDDASRS